MALQTTPYKGARDFYPEDKRLQSVIFSTLADVCERYGYELYDAPILEPTELYLSKGNTEIIEQQTYTFKDRGDRSVTLRTEMTPSVSRMVAARRQELAYPLRWYSIPQCWRYERMQRGRGREFFQLNVDVFGHEAVFAEHELLLIIRDIFESFGANKTHYRIRVSSRSLMKRIFRELLGLDDTTQKTLSHLIDRMHKLDKRVFNSQLTEQLSQSADPERAYQLMHTVLAATNIDQLPNEVHVYEETKELQKLLALAKKSKLDAVEFDPTIVRGFEYYTGIVFEVSDANNENARAMFGGGRYDSLIADFGVDPVPTVGFGMGDITLLNFLEDYELLPHTQSTTQVYLIVIGEFYEHAIELASHMRKSGITVAIDMSGRKIEKAIKSADKKHIDFVLFVGSDNITSGKYDLKNIRTGEQRPVAYDEIASAVKKG